MKLPPSIHPDEFRTVSAWHHLAVAKRITAERYETAYFESLYHRGLALRHSNGETGKYERFTYVLSTAAEEWLAAHPISQTFSQVMEKMGAEAVKKARAKFLRQQRESHSHVRIFPTGNESGRPDPTHINEDGEYSGLALTQWYTARYCALNHLKGA